MVTTRYICDVCKEDSFKTREEAEKHEKLPIIEGPYEGKVCVFGNLMYGLIIKDNSISKNMHERNYSIILVEKSHIDEVCATVMNEVADITKINYFIKNNSCKSIYGDELKKVNDFFNRLEGLPKPTSENGYESI